MPALPSASGGVRDADVEGRGVRREEIPGRQGYWRGIAGLFVFGPKEPKMRIFIDNDPRHGRIWRYKRADETHCILIGPVAKVTDVQREIEINELVARIY